VDRAGQIWIVFDIDGPREAARQRALPQTAELPAALRRLRRASVRLATGAASVGKSSGREQRYRRRTGISGSAVSATEGMGCTARNCARPSLPLIAIFARLNFHQSARCCGSTASMEPERCSLIWLGSPL